MNTLFNQDSVSSISTDSLNIYEITRDTIYVFEQMIAENASIFKNLSDVATIIIAFGAVVGIYISVRTYLNLNSHFDIQMVKSNKQLNIQRKHNVLSLKPYINIASNNLIHKIDLKITNCGNGALKIKSLKYTIDNISHNKMTDHLKDNTNKYMKKCVDEKLIECEGLAYSDVSYIVSGGSDVLFFILVNQKSYIDPPILEEIENMINEVRDKLRAINLEIEYSDSYEKNYTIKKELSKYFKHTY